VSHGQNLHYQNFKRTDFTSLPAKVPKQTLAYVEGSELNQMDRTSIGKKHTMDRRPKDKSQPNYPATSTKTPPAQAHLGDSKAQAHLRDSKALAASNKAVESAQTKRWLKEKPHQGPWNAPARVIPKETKSDESASKKYSMEDQSEEEYLDTE
jgi:hypothetical protein